MKKIYIKKILVSSFISLFSIQALFFLVEPTIADAVSAGPQAATVGLTVDPGITITTPGPVTMGAMTVAVNGSTGSTVWTVKTNNTLGYDLKVHASTTPALKDAAIDSFADYTTTPAIWSIATSTKQFGFSAYGNDTSTVTWGTGAGCGSSTTPLATMIYSGFAGVTDKTIATPSAPTPYAGVATTVCFAAEQKGVYASSGAYTATVTATATTK